MLSEYYGMRCTFGYSLLEGKQKNCMFAPHQQIDSVAQLVEQLTLNQWVVGSSPTGVTKGKRHFTDKSGKAF